MTKQVDEEEAGGGDQARLGGNPVSCRYKDDQAPYAACALEVSSPTACSEPETGSG